MENGNDVMLFKWFYTDMSRMLHAYAIGTDVSKDRNDCDGAGNAHAFSMSGFILMQSFAPHIIRQYVLKPSTCPLSLALDARVFYSIQPLPFALLIPKT